MLSRSMLAATLLLATLLTGCAHKVETYRYQLRNPDISVVNGITVIDCKIRKGTERYDAKTGKRIYDCRK